MSFAGRRSLMLMYLRDDSLDGHEEPFFQSHDSSATSNWARSMRGIGSIQISFRRTSTRRVRLR